MKLDLVDQEIIGKPHPMPKANLFMKLFFCWLLPLFKYGYKHTLEIQDLYQTLKNDSAEVCGDKLTREWKKELEGAKKTGKKPSLMRAIIRNYWLILFFNGFIVFLEEIVFKMGQPILLGILVQYFNAQTTVTRTQAYLCAAGISVCAMGLAVTHHPYFFISSRVGMRIRVAVSAMMYRKSLRLSQTALGKTTVGQLVNILSNDVNRFDQAVLFIHYIWVAPIQIIIMLVVLWYNMGPTCMVAFFTLLLLVPVQAFMGKMFSKLRSKTAVLTDERVRIMNEIISGMRIIKIHAWENPFKNLVREARRSEIQRIQLTSKLRAFNLSFFFIASNIVAFTTFIVYSSIGNTLSSVIYIALPMFNVVRLSVTLFLPYCVMFTSEGVIAVKRVQAYLLMEELPSSQLDLSYENPTHKEAVHMNNHKAVDTSDLEDEVFMVVDSMKENSSKPNEAESTDLHKKTEGDVPPVENAQREIIEDSLLSEEDRTIKIKNLGGSWGEEGSENLALEGVNVTVAPGELVAVIGPVGCGKSSLCMALLGELPIQTGEISLKGQVAYTSQQPWVFSGTLKSNIIFGREYNRKKYEAALSACALKRDIALLPDGDATMIGERGVTLSGGQRARVSLARAVYSDADIFLLDDPLSAVDTTVGRHLFEKCIKGALKKKPVILVTHQLQYLSDVDKIVILKEGKMVDCGTYEELQTNGVDFATLLKEYKDEEEKMDAMSAYSVSSKDADAASLSPEDVDFDDTGTEKIMKEGKQVGTVKSSTYVRYILAGISGLPFMVFMAFNLSSQVFLVLSDWWLSEWAYIEESCVLDGNTESVCISDSAVLNNYSRFDIEDIGRPFFFIIYSTLVLLLIILAFVRTMWLFFICVNASKNLHNQMFDAVIRTPMQFFDTNPIGRILNRFSKDIGYMDELLPVTFSDFNQISIQTVAVLITVCIFNPIVIIFTVPLIVLFVYIRSYFLATSRDVKRLEGVCRSPVFSHLSATLQGLTTIRAFRAEQRFIRTFDAYQDLHTEAWFAFLATTRWFGIMLDWLSSSFIMIVAFSSVLAADLFDLDAAEVGLSLTYSLNLMGAFQWGVRQSAEVENLMTSTERVMEYSELESEAPLESSNKPDPDWPQEGAVEFKNLGLKYSEDGPLVLKDINMKINPMEKIGIVGRTGAGKSSLTVALMRLTEPTGSILIDGVDISKLGLHDLRDKVSFIPQDPTLFTGTLRKNLDPFDSYTDDNLWTALTEVQLAPVIQEHAGKLEMLMTEGGTNFSVGQRQLLCLARAILRKNKLLIVDEATANVDLRTDKLIQATIRDKFQSCTVLTIAHRLNTIMDSDRIVVMEEGRIVEFDEPHILLQSTVGIFTKMVQETGKMEALKLMELAKQKYFETNSDLAEDQTEDLVGVRVGDPESRIVSDEKNKTDYDSNKGKELQQRTSEDSSHPEESLKHGEDPGNDN